MKTITAGIADGPVAPKHDFRETATQNVDPSLSQDNVVLEDNLMGPKRHLKINDWVDQRFQPAIDRYNENQPIKYRYITVPYTEYHQSVCSHRRKNHSLCREFLIQFGEHYETKYNKSTGENEIILDMYGDPVASLGYTYFAADEQQKQNFRDSLFMPYFRDVVQHFKEDYPHLEIVYAVAHFDEPNGTPHLHLCVCPVGERYKIGLDERVSL